MPDTHIGTTATQSASRVLYEHFLRRFFDNETLSANGDVQTVVVRGIAAVAVPGLMTAFWLIPHYPGRSAVGAEADHYFFVLYSFVAMGFVAVLEWEMLFPDRLDFLVLGAAPIRNRAIFAAKLRAMAVFSALFLVASNVFAAILMPLLSPGLYLKNLWAHCAAVTCSGATAVLLLLAVQGLMICCVPERWFRMLSPLVRAVFVAGVLLSGLLFPLFGINMRYMLAGHTAVAAYMPPLWFLGMYEWLAGQNVPVAAAGAAQLGLRWMAAAALVVLLTYPAAWAKRRRGALEGVPGTRRDASRLFGLVNALAIQQPAARGVFNFIRITLARSTRYHGIFAVYGGAGLALGLACAFTFQMGAAAGLVPAVYPVGLHAEIPLLLFWTVAGLRAAFAQPVEMGARWVFLLSNVGVSACDRAARRFVATCCIVVAAVVVAVDAALRWPAEHLAVQAVCGVALAALLTDAFFFSAIGVPFGRPRPGDKSSLPLTLLLYCIALPAGMVAMLNLQRWMEGGYGRIAALAVAAGLLHRAIAAMKRRVRAAGSEDPFKDEDEMPVTLLGIAQSAAAVGSWGDGRSDGFSPEVWGWAKPDDGVA
jgi:hypothetical protein